VAWRDHRVRAAVCVLRTQIVLLNLIIALMREIFNSVKKTEEDVFLRVSRAVPAALPRPLRASTPARPARHNELLHGLSRQARRPATEAQPPTALQPPPQGRATLIVEVETLMGRKQLERYLHMPPYVHLLTPVRRGDTREKNGMDARLDKIEQLMM
jgi:hypothetical protein